MSSSRTDAQLVDVVMPQLGVSVTEGTLLAWHCEPGGEIAVDAPLCDVQTDKVDSEVPSPAGGVLVERLVDAGETVPVGSVIARIGSAADAAAAAAAPVSAAALPEDVAPPAAAEGTEAPAARPRRLPRLSNGTRVSPVVARVAAAEGVDLHAVLGTGHGGRVTKRDVLRHLAANGSEPAAPAAPAVVAAAPAALGSGEPLSRMRQAIARAMKGSQDEAATCTTIVEVDMGAVEAVRRRDGLTYLPYVAAATVAALRRHPSLNATLGAGPPEQILLARHADVNLGIAVSIGDEGLIVPVIHSAHELSPAGLGARIKDLATRAREHRLEPDEVKGGTFTITNPGAAGAIMGTPIINRPEVAILDVEAVVRRPVVVGDAIAIRPITYLCLSWDHRALDGMAAAYFLADIKRQLEDLR